MGDGAAHHVAQPASGQGVCPVLEWIRDEGGGREVGEEEAGRAGKREKEAGGKKKRKGKKREKKKKRREGEYSKFKVKNIENLCTTGKQIIKKYSIKNKSNKKIMKAIKY